MTRSKYLSHLMTLLTADQIKLSASQPTKYMSKTQIALHFVALRKLGMSPK